MGKTSPRTCVLALLVLSLLASLPLGVLAKTDREEAGLVGPVRRVVIEHTMPASQWAFWVRQFSTDEERLARQRAAFSARVPVDVWLDSPERLAPVLANPGAWHGPMVGLIGTFQTWLTAEAALVMVGPAQWMVLRHVSAGRFTHPGEQVLLAGRLQGTTAVPLPLSRPAGVPELHVHAVEATPLLDRDTVEYDAQGNITEETWHNPDHNEWRRVTRHHIYDAQGQVRERITEQYDATGALDWKSRETYDTHGHPLEFTDYGATAAPRLVWKSRHTYDAQGHLIETVHDRDEGSLGLRGSMPTKAEARYTYDAQGRLLEKTGQSNGLHGRAWTTRYIYAPQGYRLEEAIPGEDQFASRTFTIYDPQGRILEKVSYSQILCAEEAAHAVGPLTEFKQHTLGDLGPQLEDECLYRRDRYTYEVDETTGNWRKQTINRWAPGHAAFEPFKVIYRTITYAGAP